MLTSVFLLAACGPAPVEITLSSSEVDLGPLAVGEPAEASFTLTNDGQDIAYAVIAQLLGTSKPGIAAMLDPAAGDLEPGASHTFGVEITLSDPGAGWAELEIRAEDAEGGVWTAGAGVIWEAAEEDTGGADSGR